MSRIKTSNYLAAPETSFYYATDDNDGFDREDVSFLARAVEGHDHSAGKGVSVTRVAAGSIDATALGTGAVTSIKIADFNVTNSKLGPDSITADKIAADAVGASEIVAGGVGTAELADGSVTSIKLGGGSVVAHLGYTPANAAGQAFSGAVSATSMATNGFVCTSISVVSGGNVVVAGQVQAASLSVTGQISSSAGGGTFAGAVSASDLVITNAVSGPIGSFTNVVQAPRFVSTIATGTAPFTVASTTQVANLYAARAVVADGPIDGAAGTGTMRTLGTGAAQAAAGNHGHTNAGLFFAGAYSGNGGASQTVALPFAPRCVIIQRTDSSFSQWIIASSGVTIPQLNPGASNGSVTAPTFSGNNIIVTLASGTNTSGTNNYTIMVWG